ncbi:MAG: pyridoxal phosphate-dependent aminotransferase [Candidatus Hermodarchaeota archaeon]
MKELSKTVTEAPKSKIRELFDLAAGRSDVISLGIGQPDFSTPQPAIQGTIDALNKKITYYAPTRGVPELLQSIEKKLRVDNKIEANWKEHIIVTNGGSQALNLAFATIFNPGDEMLIFSPNFLSYFYLALFSQVKVIEIERNANFSPNLDKIEHLITNKTKAILINSPNNPTGYAFNRKELDRIINLVVDNDLYLISDEVYENYLYDGIKHVSPSSIDEMFQRTITINAMSKLYSATGFRLGYVVANKDIIALIEKYHQYTVAGTNHAAQYGFIQALNMEKKFFEPILKSFEQRRNLVYSRLIELGLNVSKPSGAFYIMPSLENYNISGSEFSNRLMKEQAVALVPGNAFGTYSDNRVRISYATSIEKLEEALNRIEKFVNTL